MRNLCARRLRAFVSIFALSIAVGAVAGHDQCAQAQENSGAGSAAGASLQNGNADARQVKPSVAEGDGNGAGLPDAPAPAELTEAATVRSFDFAATARESSSAAQNLDFLDTDGGFVSTRAVRNPEEVPLNACPTDTSHARECRVHWGHLLATTAVFNAFQNAGNLYSGYWYRYETTHGHWMRRWFDSATEWRWNVWNDQNPVMDDYVGHPMMGAITNSLWIQDDPKGATVEFGNTREYWHSRMRAFVFSTAYSFEWKFGPFGEAGIGHNGDHLVPQGNGKPWTNETGVVELVTTPVGGFLWTMAEDALDKHVVKGFEEKPRGALALVAISFLTPARATANIFRFRPPWYRDGRVVKANSFWSEPDGPREANLEPGVQPNEELAHAGPAAAEGGGAGGVMPVRRGEALPVWPHYGGVHEFGAWWGLSMFSGPIWGYDKDVNYMPVDLNYSYLLNPNSRRWNFRYAPEVTALAMLDEPAFLKPGVKPQPQNLRRRTYGSGLSPVGFRTSFAPGSRVQPFLSTDGGFIYFSDRVLSPQGSQFMYTIDFGGGVTVYRKQRQAISFGYRYQHLSNANISRHNPGTDANTFYVQVSRFRTKGYR